MDSMTEKAEANDEKRRETRKPPQSPPATRVALMQLDAWTLAEAADVLDVTQRTIRNYIRNKELDVIEIGGRKLIRNVLRNSA